MFRQSLQPASLLAPSLLLPTCNSEERKENGGARGTHKWVVARHSSLRLYEYGDGLSLEGRLLNFGKKMKMKTFTYLFVEISVN